MRIRWIVNALVLVSATQACAPRGDGGRPADEPAAVPERMTSPIAEDPNGGPCDEGEGCPRVRLRFRDVTRQARNITEKPRESWGALWADWDGNGYPDLFIGRHGSPPTFLSNEAGTYTRVAVDFVDPPGYDPIDGGTGVDRHSCAWGEANGDRQPDLYCDVGADRGLGVGPNQLFVQGRHGLRESAVDMRVSDPFGRSKSVNWLDHDGDGDLDLFVGNAMRSDRRTTNALFEHTRNGFRRSNAGLDDRLVTMSSSWADWDVDGDPDLLALQYPSSTRPAVAYENVDGTFRRTTLEHVSGGAWHASAWGDYDGDGRSDLALVGIDRLAILRNSRTGLEPTFSMALGKGQMAVWFDVENDGDLDLFVVQGAPPPMDPIGSNVGDLLLLRSDRGFHRARLPMLRGPRDGCGDSAAIADHDRDGRVDVFLTNGAEGGCRGSDVLLENVSTGGHWVAIDLLGEPENPWGVGSRIHVRAGRLSYWRDVTDGVAFRSQSEIGHQVLGIGSSVSADVKVMWPDGTMDCLRLEAGTTRGVRQGALPCS